MEEANAIETPKADTTNFKNIAIIIVLLIPLNYALYVTLKPSLPTQTTTTAAETPVVDMPNFNTYLNMGLTYYNNHNFEDAISTWKKAAEYNPNSALIYNNIAAAYGCLHKSEEQVTYCEKALAIDPTFQLAKNNLAWAKEELSKQNK
jgi:tetratricopeptide (TPR) repeat protein